MDSAVCREPPPPRQLISLREEEFALPQHKFNTSAVLTSLRGRFGQISLHDHHFLPVLKILTPHPPNSDFSRLGSETPPEASWSSFCLPSGGSAERLRSGQVRFLPHSRALLGLTRLAPGNPGTESLRLDQLPILAAWNCPWGDRAAARDGAGDAAEIQGA